jgi:hypothetical protein
MDTLTDILMDIRTDMQIHVHTALLTRITSMATTIRQNKHTPILIHILTPWVIRKTITRNFIYILQYIHAHIPL